MRYAPNRGTNRWRLEFLRDSICTSAWTPNLSGTSCSDLSESKNLMQVKDGEKVSMKGMLYGMKTVPTRSRKINLIKAMFYDQYGNGAEVVWFNQPFVKRMVPMDTEVIVSGKVQFQYGKYTIQNPQVELASKTQIHTAGMVPVYPQHEVITSKWLRGKIHPLLHLSKEFEEILPTIQRFLNN